MSKNNTYCAVFVKFGYFSFICYSIFVRGEQCKHILSDPQILAYIIKSCVKECKDINMKDLVAYFEKHPAITGKEDTSISGSKIVYDIFATVEGSLLDDKNDVGLIINIEPQKSRNLPYHLERRKIHNNCRLIAQ